MLPGRLLLCLLSAALLVFPRAAAAQDDDGGEETSAPADAGNSSDSFDEDLPQPQQPAAKPRPAPPQAKKKPKNQAPIYQPPSEYLFSMKDSGNYGSLYIFDSKTGRPKDEKAKQLAIEQAPPPREVWLFGFKPRAGAPRPAPEKTVGHKRPASKAERKLLGVKAKHKGKAAGKKGKLKLPKKKKPAPKPAPDAEDEDSGWNSGSGSGASVPQLKPTTSLETSAGDNSSRGPSPSKDKNAKGESQPSSEE
ncbi:MAG: hypothetical protein WC421_08005 [Elusimicrobiales bacterium]